MVASSLAGSRAPRSTSAPWRASSSTVCSPMPLVTPVTSARRPVRSGMSARRPAGPRSLTVLASRGDRQRGQQPAAELLVALDPRAGRDSGPRRPPASTTKSSAPRVTVPSGSSTVGGSGAAVVADRRGPLAGRRTSRRTVVPAGGATRLPTTIGSERGEDPITCGGGGAVVAAGPAGRPAYVLLVHPHVEGPVAQQRPVGPAGVARASSGRGLRVGGRVGQQRGVPRGDGVLDLVGQLGHRAVAAGQHALLGVVVDRGRAGAGRRRPRRSPRACRRAPPRGARCARRCPSRPSRRGRSGSPSPPPGARGRGRRSRRRRACQGSTSRARCAASGAGGGGHGGSVRRPVRPSSGDRGPPVARQGCCGLQRRVEPTLLDEVVVRERWAFITRASTMASAPTMMRIQPSVLVATTSSTLAGRSTTSSARIETDQQQDDSESDSHEVLPSGGVRECAPSAGRTCAGTPQTRHTGPGLRVRRVRGWMRVLEGRLVEVHQRQVGRLGDGQLGGDLGQVVLREELRRRDLALVERLVGRPRPRRPASAAPPRRP